MKKAIILTAFILSAIILSAQTIEYPVDMDYDATTDTYLLSNWGDGEGGYIIRMNREGFPLELFYNGLDYAGGIRIVGGTVYVLNNKDLINGSLPSYVVGIDLYTANMVSNTEISSGPCYLELMDNDSEGFLYITDRKNKSVIKYNTADHSFSTIKNDIYNPFGICYDHIDDRLIVLSSSLSGTVIYSIDRVSTEIDYLGFFQEGFLEGIIMDDEGNFYLTSWGDTPDVYGDEKVYKYNHGITFKAEISNGHNRPFGLAMKGNDSILVANWGDNTLSKISLAPFGVNEFPGNVSFSIYPNPGTGLFSVEADEIAGQVKWELVNHTGKSLLNGELTFDGVNNRRELDLTDAGKGTFLLLFTTGNQTFSHKLIIN